MFGTRKGKSDELVHPNTIRMQRQQIEKLKKDNERYKEDLALETRQAKQASNMSASAQIARLQDQGDMYTRKIEIEKRRVHELDKQIKQLQGVVQQQRKVMGGVNAAQERAQNVQKNIRMLENQLDKALVKFNEALAHNKQLRESIENLRRERIVFDGIQKKLERELVTKKGQMQDIVRIAGEAYESRGRAQKEMVALKAQADIEQENFEMEWEQLAQLIDKDRRMKDILSAHERERNTAKIGDPEMEREQKLKKKVATGAWVIAKDKANIHLSMEKVQSYEEAFAKIQKATQITDIDELVDTFINAEDQNFSLFNYVNDLSSEIERLEEGNGVLKTELDTYKKGLQRQQDNERIRRGSLHITNQEAGALAATSSALIGQYSSMAGDAKQNSKLSKDEQRKEMLKDLAHRLERTERTAVKYEEKHTRSLKTVERLKAGIQALFNKVGCEDSALSEILGLGNSGVTDSNMMQFLGLIEQKVSEYLLTFQEVKARDNGYANAMQMQNDQAYNQQLGYNDQGEYSDDGSNDGYGGINMNDNDMLDDDDVIDDDEDVRPFFRDELVNQISGGR